MLARRQKGQPGEVPRDIARELAREGVDAARQNANADLGFGQQVGLGSGRLVNADGSFNVRRLGLPFWARFSAYHWMIHLSWPRFLGVVALFYLSLNAVFATLYLSLGPDALGGTDLEMNLWLRGFFFSSQTLTTVGYGHIHPVGLPASFVAAIESLVGLMAFALVTSLGYARFAKARPHILFSANAVVAPFQGGQALMFRMANALDAPLIELRVQVVLSYVVFNQATQNQRLFQPLPLERSQVTLFPTSWTLVHPITQDSPLHGLTDDLVQAMQAEVLVMVTAFDEAHGQTVHARYSYRADEIRWGEKFVPMFQEREDGMTDLHLDRLNARIPMPLPQRDLAQNGEPQATERA